MPKENQHLASLRRRAAKLTVQPGVYRWLDARGTVLYVGKAKNLKNRIRNYLQKNTAPLGPWKQSLMQHVADLNVTVTNTEIEALILETNLIKQFKPKYNVLMKDDKNYVYVRITVQEAFPKIEVIRRPLEDKARYFGPYTRALDIKDTLTVLRKVFPYRTCRMHIERNADGSVSIKNRDRPTPCLDFHIKQCPAPCTGAITSEEYRASIDGIVAFLKGNTEQALTLLEERMRAAARDRKFEQAAKLRDALKSLENLERKHIVSDTSGEDADIFGVALSPSRAHVVLLKERGGKVIDESSFALTGSAENAAELLMQFLPQYYAAAAERPPLLIIGEELPERGLLEAWLTELRGSRITILTPERGKKNKLLELAEKNVQAKIDQFETKWEAAARNVEEALEELKETLGLSVLPNRIEGYDISHLGGTETVGSMSVFIEGKPKNDQYRSFTIRTLASGDVDDFRSLAEVLRRRLKHLRGGIKQEVRAWKEKGIELRKARKSDQAGIKSLIKANPENLSSKDLGKGIFFVAVREKKIVGCCRLFEHITGLHELRSVCIAKKERGQHLGQSLIRVLLGKQKRGKVYIVIDPNLEEYYTEIGFRHILRAPPVLERKVKKLLADDPSLKPPVLMMYDPMQHKADASLETAPDLILIDGGKGQLSTVCAVMKELALDLPVIGLAKREEEIFIPGTPAPLTFPKESQAKFLLMRLRDEAHRFANAHREGRGKKSAVLSSLDLIPGIGPQTRNDLIRRFGSLSGIKDATDEDLLEILTEAQLQAMREAQ
ncbi:MAG: excinuclease ABC subunit UvrC [Candidatus Peribacteraceae bacterium]|nr:excinuclease ABC subunit UvrC [Candidatus Peribacteraceae bacterium]MDD5074850.1 excinuclease ABC subunit UvrC [Candidatus Peribacteraceae bacterium]